MTPAHFYAHPSGQIAPLSKIIDRLDAPFTNTLTDDDMAPPSAAVPAVPVWMLEVRT